MFVALDKLHHQGISKVIVAVPERSIGGSFGVTNLASNGFFTSWEPNPLYNLCTSDGEKSKVEAFKKFMVSDEQILICTHATLRFAFKELDESKFDNCLLAIDEFHHVSADGENQLGELIRSVMQNSTAHIAAMTGSYFRGDSVPVLLPEDEARFFKVTYNYYEQLNGYEHLKSLGIGYHFYQGRYTDAIAEILDTDKKTILHIPNQKGELKIRGFKKPSSKRVEDILESDLNDLKAAILQDDVMVKAIPGNVDAEVINRVLIPKIIKVKYPDLSDNEVEEVRQHVVIDSVVKNGHIIESGDKKFIKMADKFVNIDDLHIDLIDQVNPFQKAFEILSKSVTTHVLKLIQESIEATRIEMTPEEAVILYKKIPAFKSEHGRMPDSSSMDFGEKRMAEALIYLNKLRRERANG